MTEPREPTDQLGIGATDMTDNTQPEALRLADALEYCDASVARQAINELRRQHARIAEMEAQLESIDAGGVSGPLMGKPQEMPDLSALTERGAKAWAGVDARGLRDGVACAGSEPVAGGAIAEVVMTVRPPNASPAWLPHKIIYASLQWLDSVPVGTKLYTHPSPPEGMVGGWIASKDQMPPPGVRVFWGDVDSNRVGYDFWAGDDYRWTPSHWMHIPEFPAPPTTSAGSGKGERE